MDDSVVGEIGPGILALVCAERGDTEENATYFAHKTALMRIFSDKDGKTNLSVSDVGGSVLAISQFTLAAEWRKGNRPGFSRAEEPENAKRLYDVYCDALREKGLAVETGIFAADMEVSLINDGPFTIVMDGRD